MPAGADGNLKIGSNDIDALNFGTGEVIAVYRGALEVWKDSGIVGMYFGNNSVNTALFYNLDRTRDSSKDISLGTGDWLSALALEDGMYFVDDTLNRARFYNLDRTRDSTRDINLGTGTWEASLSLEDGMYFVQDDVDTARFYNLDRTRDSSRDISLEVNTFF